MRVLLLTHSYSPEVSPPQRRWDSFVYVMREAGWKVQVVTPRVELRTGTTEPNRWIGRAEVGAHGEIIRSYASLRKPRTILGKLIKNALDGTLMLPRALLQARPSVVIATVPALPTMFVGFIVARIFRRPLLLEMRDAWPDLITDSRILRWKWLTRLAHWGVREIQRRATIVVTVTDGFAKILSREGVPAVRTIHNGISTRNFEVLPSPPKRNNSKLHVLYLGNLGESQSLESVILASTMVSDGIQVRIVGAGTASERLKRYAETIDANIDFRSPARGDSLRSHYQWADTCVVSLRDDWASFNHTVPSKIYELMSLSRHITGIVTGEAARIISDASAGDIVDHDPNHIADLWQQLYRDKQRTDVGTTGRDWVFENASLEKLGQKYVELISGMTGRERDRG
ncbi:glycosyltransferase family 4 protein [Arthrobacter sp. AQ5-05]|uniref:glycosyltransferase family 4 protein n=1 Tax=Arthrobacter sp. AQ5-05 TaxID=2184581 RepID=UPI001C660588|nr:glycosyltransferase family 4 protein [Arthrobacter sp. AQ5-05]